MSFRKTSITLSAFALAASALLAVPAAASAASPSEAPPAYYPSGPQLDVDQSQLEGWTLCYSGAFGEQGVPLYGADGILSELCTGEYLMLAGSPVGSTTLTLLAAAPRADVLFDTGVNAEVTHLANGTEWYFNAGWSWGFALAGDDVAKTNCDVSDVNEEYRLCFHAATGGGEDFDALAVDETAHLAGGYRLGATTDLNDSSDYTRYIYQTGVAAPAAVAAPTLPNTGTDASMPLLLAGGLLAAGLLVASVSFARRRTAQ